MTNYELSPHAKAAIADIYDYTFDRWGPKQADQYIDGLIDLFDRIVLRHEPWRPIPPEYDVHGYWCRYQQHHVYWRQYGNGEIGIAAILHVSMIQGERLKDAFGN